MKIPLINIFIPLEIPVDLIIRPSGECRLSNFCFGNAPIPSFGFQMFFGLILIKTYASCYSGLSKQEQAVRGV